MLIRSVHFLLERWREASREAVVAEREFARAQITYCRGEGPAPTADMVNDLHELQRVEHELFRAVFEQMDRASAMACQRGRWRSGLHGQGEAGHPGEQGGTG